jgi:hypothetical protein
MTEEPKRPSPAAIAKWWVSEDEQQLADLFDTSTLPVAARLDTFPRYVTWEWLARFTNLYELYRLILPVKGAIADGGVLWGFSFMSFLRLRRILEPRRTDRYVYGFDSFEGFPAVSAEEQPPGGEPSQFRPWVLTWATVTSEDGSDGSSNASPRGSGDGRDGAHEQLGRR